ncbi:MAG: hypothetical protein HY372_00450 [Candidatus Andersenbacteria bacterium]|nr:hypothetical protein [Candidatus Andersenbacteria bacterium]
MRRWFFLLPAGLFVGLLVILTWLYAIKPVTAPEHPAGVPDEFVSGESRFSRGACAQDSECQTAGCSGEICTSEPSVFSTCEYSDEFPNARGLNCGCVSGQNGDGVCGWR